MLPLMPSASGSFMSVNLVCTRPFQTSTSSSIVARSASLTPHTSASAL